MLRKSDYEGYQCLGRVISDYAFAVGIVIAGIVYMAHTKNRILIF